MFRKMFNKWQAIIGVGEEGRGIDVVGFESNRSTLGSSNFG